MANKKFFVGMSAITLALGLLLAGCASTVDGGRYNADSPPEQDCSLNFKGASPSPLVKIPHVTTFDGEQVNWKAEIGTIAPFKGKSFTVKIPAGEHTLNGVSVGAMGANAGTLSITYTFIAGRSYTIKIKDSSFEIVDK
jgi:muramoyltetrapeptide carboxypeptidase LdcA involved in peptidoglycan recycling